MPSVDAILAKDKVRPDEVAQVLGWSRSTVYFRIKSGEIPVLGGRTPYNIPGAWLREQRKAEAQNE